MKQTNDERIRDLLRQAFRPENTELQRDLWPRMLQRFDRQSAIKAVPWFDWALLALLAIFILAFPHSIPVLLYHL
jgi:hypothetical protein